MTRTMYDSIDANTVPASATMVAGYVDGKWPSAAALKKRFPHATLVEIAVFHTTDEGQVLDVETGDATPVESVSWVQMRRRAGADPSVYCNSSVLPSVVAAFKSAGVAQPHYWIAHWDNVATLPAGAVAKQYANSKMVGHNYDVSVVADYWPGVDPKPVPVVTKPPTAVPSYQLQPGFPTWKYNGPQGDHDAWYILNDMYAWILKIAEKLGVE